MRPSPLPAPRPRLIHHSGAQTSFLVFSRRNPSRRAESQLSAAPPPVPRVHTRAAGWRRGCGGGGSRNCPSERDTLTFGVAGGVCDISGGGGGGAGVWFPIFGTVPSRALPEEGRGLREVLKSVSSEFRGHRRVSPENPSLLRAFIHPGRQSFLFPAGVI